MSTSMYYNYSGKMIGDVGDNFVGKKAEQMGEILTFENARNTAGHSVSFIAFVNTFSQNFTSNWNTQEALGRMDDIATFKNTTRAISVAWEIPSEDSQTALENLNRCNALIAMLYPEYTDKGTNDRGSYIMSKPPLVRLQYSNLIQTPKGGGLLGYITSLNWTPVLEMGSFHHGGDIYPKVISISVEFTVLHEATDTKKSAGPTGFFGSDTNNGLRHTNRYKDGSAGRQGGGWPFGGISSPNGRQPYVSPAEKRAQEAADRTASENNGSGDENDDPIDGDFDMEGLD